MAWAAGRHDSPDATTGEAQVRDLYEIPLELGLGVDKKWRGITHAVEVVADVEPNDKRKERGKGDL